MRRPPLFTLLTLAVVFGTAPLRGADDEAEYRNASYGFLIRRPARWLLVEQPGTGGEGVALNIVPPGGGTAAAVRIDAKLAATPRSAEEIRHTKLAGIEGKKDYPEAKPVDGKLGGRAAPGIDVVYVKDGRRFRIRQIYLVHEDVEIVFQCHGLADSFSAHAGAFEQIRKSFRLLPIPTERRRAGRQAAMAARCGSEIDWVRSWKDAAARAREGRRPVLVYVRRLSGFRISDPAMAGVFMDRDFVDLVRERFVAHRLDLPSTAPFVSPEAYGLSGSTFGSALLVVAPSGKVLAETWSLVSTSVDVFLRDTLARHPELAGRPGPLPEDPDDRAEIQVRRGELDPAMASLRARKSARAHRLRAAIHRRHRRGEDALASLEAAREAGLAGDDTGVERAIVLIGMGRFEDADRELSQVGAKSPRRSEALFLLGILRLRDGERDAAASAWWSLVDDRPEDRWAWRAASALESTAFALALPGRLRWPREEILDAMRRPVPEAREVREARKARREARDHLLGAQQGDGSWVCPLAISRPESPRRNHFTVAITALAATSLIPDRSDPKAAAAIRKARSWLARAHRAWKTSPEPVHFTDYGVWSRMMHLRLLAAVVRAEVASRTEVGPLAGEIVASLLGRQRPGGGFSYYVTRNLAGGRDTQSISFVTAAAALALLDARDVGIPLPDGMLERCLAGLLAMRNPNGTFSYMKAPGVRRPDATREPGAAGRGPLCALALHRGGRADLDLVRRTLELFVTHRKALGKERRKVLMHTGADGQGSHYLMFDYAMTAEAIRALPEAERPKPRDALLEEILALRLEDGAYLDNPFLGRAFGAAMALLAYECLGVPR